MRYAIFICLCIVSGLALVTGECDIVPCLLPMVNFTTPQGAIKLKFLAQTCAVFPDVSTCVESEMNRCGISKAERYAWYIGKAMTDMICFAADYAQLAPCLRRSGTLAAMHQCNKNMLKHLLRDNGVAAKCRVFKKRLSCIRSAFKSCRKKAEDMMNIVSSNLMELILETGEGCETFDP